MKYLVILIFAGMISCSEMKSSAKMEGVYTANIVNQFANVNDTLILRKANDGSSIYQIQKHSGITQMLDGRRFPRENRSDTWTLDYDPDKQIFTELRQGRIIIWDNTGNSLLIGKTRYKKIGS